jgi:hypothetical protein
MDELKITYKFLNPDHEIFKLLLWILTYNKSVKKLFLYEIYNSYFLFLLYGNITS